MSHLEERLEHDLTEIRDQIADLGTKSEQAMEGALRSLQTADDKLAFTTILSDLPINRQMRKIDRMCHSFIAVHLPSAGHLRLMSSVIRANIILERIGDYAVTIAREAVQLGEIPEGPMSAVLKSISDDCMSVLGEAISAFNTANAERAREAIALARRVEHDMDGIYAELLEACGDNGTGCSRHTLIYLIIFSQLKRVSDQAKNLSEETIFVETGETKAPKVYRILFVDKDSSCLAPMAQLIAHKIFPDVGVYTHAGVGAADALNSEMVSFMRERGFDLAGVHPAALNSDRESLSENHVIVGLDQKVQEAVGKLPFRTSALNWKHLEVPGGDDRDGWEDLHKNLALQIRELLTLLRGHENL